MELAKFFENNIFDLSFMYKYINQLEIYDTNDLLDRDNKLIENPFHSYYLKDQVRNIDIFYFVNDAINNLHRSYFKININKFENSNIRNIKVDLNKIGTMSIASEKEIILKNDSMYLMGFNLTIETYYLIVIISKYKIRVISKPNTAEKIYVKEHTFTNFTYLIHNFLNGRICDRTNEELKKINQDLFSSIIGYNLTNSGYFFNGFEVFKRVDNILKYENTFIKNFIDFITSKSYYGFKNKEYYRISREYINSVKINYNELYRWFS